MAIDLPPVMPIVERLERSEEMYRKVEGATGVCWMLIACIHYRECSGSFKRSLKDGRELKPKEDWELDAIRSLSDWMKKMHYKGRPDSMGAMLEFAEKWNGTGYSKLGRTSPYVWSGTPSYVRGKFVSDKKLDPNKVDEQWGVQPLLKLLWARHVVETDKP